MLSHREEQDAYKWYESLEPELQETLLCNWIRGHYEKKVLVYEIAGRKNHRGSYEQS